MDLAHETCTRYWQYEAIFQAIYEAMFESIKICSSYLAENKMLMDEITKVLLA